MEKKAIMTLKGTDEEIEQAITNLLEWVTEQGAEIQICWDD